MQKGHIIHAAGQMREQIADPLATLTILFKCPAGFDDSAGIAVATASECLDRDSLIVSPLHFGLVIERINMAGAAIHKQKDDTFGLRRMVQCL